MKPLHTETCGPFTLEIFQDECPSDPTKDMDFLSHRFDTRYNLESQILKNWTYGSAFQLLSLDSGKEWQFQNYAGKINPQLRVVKKGKRFRFEMETP